MFSVEWEGMMAREDGKPVMPDVGEAGLGRFMKNNRRGGGYPSGQ